MELSGLDTLFRLKGASHCDSSIVIVEITNDDISRIGRWAWDRSWHAAIIKALKDFGAHSIYFDILFSEPSSEEGDKLLESSIKEAGNVYLPFAFSSTSYDTKDAIMPLPQFSSVAKGMGAINIYPDIDGLMRRAPLVFAGRDATYPNIALKISMDYDNLKSLSLTPGIVKMYNENNRVNIPVDSNNDMLINWPGKWKDTFKHYSFLDVLTAYQDNLEHKKPEIDIDGLKDKICLVGVTATGLYDIKPIPMEPLYPGVGIVASTINTILTRDFIRTVPLWVNIAIIYILALFPSILVSGDRPLRDTVFVFLIAAFYFAIAFILFRNGFKIDAFKPLAGLLLSYFIIGTYNFVRTSIDRQHFFKMSVTDGLTGLYNIRYFKMLLESEIMITRPDPTKKFSIIMGDIDHFKNFNDTYGHQVGDMVLKSVAKTIKSSVRNLDVVARYGGEEVIILLRGTALNYALPVAENIRKSVENYIVEDQNNKYAVTISLGVASFKSTDTVDDLIKRADEGLYKAKESGRNRVFTVDNP